jgi:hypothetical protein
VAQEDGDPGSPSIQARPLDAFVLLPRNLGGVAREEEQVDLAVGGERLDERVQALEDTVGAVLHGGRR